MVARECATGRGNKGTECDLSSMSGGIANRSWFWWRSEKSVRLSQTVTAYLAVAASTPRKEKKVSRQFGVGDWIASKRPLTLAMVSLNVLS